MGYIKRGKFITSRKNGFQQTQKICTKKRCNNKTINGKKYYEL